MINELSQKRYAEGFTRQAVLGDFNSEKGFVSGQTNGVFKDSIDHIQDPTKRIDPQQTQWRGKRIDFVMVNKDIHETTVTKGGTIPSGASDHIPVFADLSFKPGQTGAPPNLRRASEIFKDNGMINPFVRSKLQNIVKVTGNTLKANAGKALVVAGLAIVGTVAAVEQTKPN
jgi:hypothetical protein